MFVLYVTSSEPGAGKTALCAGLGKKWQQAGKRVGYVKVARDTGSGHRDASAIRELLSIIEPEESLVAAADVAAVKKAGDTFSSRDILLVEGLSGLGGEEGRLSQEIVRSLSAKPLALVAYSSRFSMPEVAEALKKWSTPAVGIVVNGVPSKRLKAVQAAIAAQKDGLKPLAVLQEDRTLMGLTVAEVARCVNGEILNSPEKASELVENIMVNAFAVEGGVVYFSRKANKAVIARGGRADVQLAALRTPTSCIIVTEGVPPEKVVAAEAKERQIPIILAKQGAESLLSALERCVVDARFQGEKKMAKWTESLDRAFDFASLNKSLGLG